MDFQVIGPERLTVEGMGPNGMGLKGIGPKGIGVERVDQCRRAAT
jgi:hypothetical protein